MNRIPLRSSQSGVPLDGGNTGDVVTRNADGSVSFAPAPGGAPPIAQIAPAVGDGGIRIFEMGASSRTFFYVLELTGSYEALISETGADDGDEMYFAYSASGDNTIGLRREVDNESLTMAIVGDGTQGQLVLGGHTGACLFALLKRIGGVWRAVGCALVPAV